MNKLWEVIKVLSLKEDSNQYDLAFAESMLSTEEYVALEEYLLVGNKSGNNNQWV